MENRAVIYIRVSDPSQVDNNSLETQENICKSFAKSKNIEIVRVFREEGISAKNTNRLALKELLTFCYQKKNLINSVIVYKLNRLSRNTEDGLGLEAYLSKQGINVMSATEMVSQDAIGRFSRSVLYAVGQLENEIKGEAVRDNMKSAFKKGIWLWQCPIGYKKRYQTKEQNKGIPPIIDTDKSSLVLKLFEDASTGLYSQKQLVDRINIFGFKRIIKFPATTSIVKKIITNSFYYGEMYCSKWNLRVLGLHDPLISKDLWEKSNFNLYNINRKYKIQDSATYPLKGIIKCDVCGKEMTSSNPKGRNKQYFHYECKNKFCRKTRISIDNAHEKFLNHLKMIKPNERIIKLFNKMVFDEWDKVIDSGVNEVEILERQILSYKDELKIVAKSLEKGIYSEEMAKSEADNINREILLLNIKRSDIKIEQYDAEKISNFTRHFLLNFDNLWLRIDELPIKQALQNKIFPNGIYCTENKEIRTAGLSHSFELINTLSSPNSAFGDPMGIRTPDLLAENQSS